MPWFCRHRVILPIDNSCSPFYYSTRGRGSRIQILIRCGLCKTSLRPIGITRRWEKMHVGKVSAASRMLCRPSDTMTINDLLQKEASVFL